MNGLLEKASTFIKVSTYEVYLFTFLCCCGFDIVDATKRKSF